MRSKRDFSNLQGGQSLVDASPGAWGEVYMLDVAQAASRSRVSG